ncbi:MAG TPA: hypothetical protein VF469_13740 [Kofleriaceae bacterium]
MRLRAGRAGRDAISRSHMRLNESDGAPRSITTISTMAPARDRPPRSRPSVLAPIIGVKVGERHLARPLRDSIDAGISLRIADRDWAVLGALESGAPLDPAAVMPLASDADPEVRELCLRCLAASAGASPEPLLHGLTDAAARVRLAALRGVVLRSMTIPGARLLGAFDASPDAFARTELALALGKHADVDVAEIASRESRERDPEAHQALLVALARRGDPEARKRFAASIPDARGLARQKHLEACRYLGEPWVLKPMASLLDDPSPVSRVGNDAEPAKAVFIRVCDLAAAIVAEIAPGSDTVAHAPVAAETIEAAKRYIAALPD